MKKEFFAIIAILLMIIVISTFYLLKAETLINIKLDTKSNLPIEGNNSLIGKSILVDLIQAIQYHVLPSNLHVNSTNNENTEVTSIGSIYEVNLYYKVIGETIPHPPKVTLYFPNGSIYTANLNISLKVPAGTVYSIEGTVSNSNGTRWSTNNATSGIITEAGNVFIVYYEQVEVTFSYKVIGGGIYGSPVITYYSFGIQNSAIVPTTAWVDYNTSYTFPQLLPGSNSQERWISFNYSGRITSPGTVTATYYNEYYVNVSSQIPVYGIVDGVNQSLVSGWYNANTTIQVENITYYVSSTVRDVIISVSPSTALLVVNSPLTIRVNAVTQYYVNVLSPIPAHAIINGVSENLTSGWYNSGTQIKVENITYYNSPVERQIITYIYPNSVIVKSQTTIVIKTTIQYFVNVSSPIPVHALINGDNESLESGWYNANTTIQVENITYYNSPVEREIIAVISPSPYLVVDSPITITINTITQYYVNVTSLIPVYAIMLKNIASITLIYNNNTQTHFTEFEYTLVNLTSGWYDKGIVIQIINTTYYLSKFEREIIVSISPNISIYSGIIPRSEGIVVLEGNNTPSNLTSLTSPLNIVVNTTIQYFVNVSSTIPVKAIVNGKLTILNSSWINSKTNITILNYTYYLNPTERFIIVNISPSSEINVTKPLNIVIVADKQYLVIINGLISWYTAGSKIYLNANIPFLEKGRFIGTYNLSPGSVLVVNEPIRETLVEYLNYAILIPISATIIIIIAVVGVLIIIIRGRK